MKFLRFSAVSLLSLILVTSFVQVGKTASSATTSADEPSKLLVLWTSGDRDVALNMVFMYTYSAKKQGWWDTVRFIVWGHSTKLLSVDEELQQEIQKMKDEGVELFACKACADRYGVSKKLEDLGLTVKYVGQDLTNFLKKSDWATLTF